jgi:L-ascorbate metabolism protein UlaG (beta-lactamase superfamily)
VIQPRLQDFAFLTDVANAASYPDVLHVWWLGQSGFLIKHAAGCLLFDPYLSDSLTAKYAATDKPHIRMTARVIAPERLDFLQVVTSSHNHTDHLDAGTLRPLFAMNPALRLVFPEANRAFAAGRLGFQSDDLRLLGLDDGTRANVAGFQFIGIPAAHNDLERDEQGRCKYLGFIVRCGPFTIYHSGDTLLYPGLEERLRTLGPIDLALLPINGNKPERRVAGNLDGPEAARLAHAIGARCVVPCHYEMFEFNSASPDAFVAECEKLRQAYRVLHAGERLSL